MNDIRLSVVIPTRNRAASVLRLLEDIEKQTMPCAEFEVVVVDDGSELPLELGETLARLSFAARVIRRTENHGAHEARFEGLRQAAGKRVLFLDDDLSLSPEVLAEHARVADSFAMGIIRYHPEASVTPYQRYKSNLYDLETAQCEEHAHNLATEYLYICNSSAPKGLYLKVFQTLRDDFAEMTMGGDGFDESLMSVVLNHYEEPVKLLAAATVFHIDDKTLAEACRERAQHGMLDCHLVLKFPLLRPEMPVFLVLTGNASAYRTFRARLMWLAPGILRMMARAFTFAADRVRWLPAGICRFPMTVAYWEGVRTVLPTLGEIRRTLGESCTASQ